MAYVYNEVIGISPFSTTSVLYGAFSRWSNWDHVEEDVMHIVADVEYRWDIYYVDNTVQINPDTEVNESYVGKLGIAVPAHNPSVLNIYNRCYIVTRDEEGTLTFLEDILLLPSYQLLMIATNTAFYIGVRTTATDTPHGLFATVVMNQQNKEQSEVAVGFYDYTSCKLYDIQQITGTTVDIQPLTIFPDKYHGYTFLLPMHGLDYGVASGLYCFLYSQNSAPNRQFCTMTMNGKTFYVDDNIALIDYFTGL